MRTHKKLRELISTWHNGAGVLIYKSSESTIIEVDVIVNRKTKQLCYCATGKPVEFDVDFEEEDENKWMGDFWKVKYYPDGYARWTLENGNTSISWLVNKENNFTTQEQFIKFLRERENESNNKTSLGN